MSHKAVRNSGASSQPSKSIWQRSVLAPGLAVIALVVVGRLLGLFQTLEWKTLDSFLRWRPAEPQDRRVLVVGIDEADLQSLETYPIPDATLSALIQTLGQHQPRAIGLDIVRDFPVNPGHDTLVETLAAQPEVYGIEKISDPWVLPPPSLPPERVGFVDFPLDSDGFARQAYLGAYPDPTYPNGNEFRFSLALRLAQTYLVEAGLDLDNGRQDPSNMSFGEKELFQVQPNSGGYVGIVPWGNQILINVRSGEAPFQVVSMADVMTGRVGAEAIRDRVVLIGITAISVKDIVNSAAVASSNPGLVNGVELHAHVVSQILSHVLDDRPMLRSWGDGWEYLWIIAWGGVGILLVRRLDRPALYMVAVGLFGLGLVVSSFLALWLGGWWLPLIPTLLVFMVNGVVLPGFYLFYLYNQTLQSRIEERQWVIKHTYDTIHNGPLQTLALLLKEKATLEPRVANQLETLNQELREVHQRLLQGSLLESDYLQIGSQYLVDLRHPFDEVLYEIYAETLRRDFPGFKSIKFQVVKFEPLRVEDLSADDKRALCRFLEEALCNVGKHAVKATRLSLLCLATDSQNLIQIEDNGQVSPHPTDCSGNGRGGDGHGTAQAHALAQRLGGQFERTTLKQGTRCTLSWPLPCPKPWWRP